MRKQPKLGFLALVSSMMIVLAACQGGGRSPSGGASGGASPAGSQAATGFAACGTQDSGTKFKIGGVTDVGQLEDKSFNEAGWCGTLKGIAAVGGSGDVIVTKDPADYKPNMQRFIDEKFNIIVTYGFALGDATLEVARANPDIQFIGLDQSVCVTPEGVKDKTGKCAGDASKLVPNYQGLTFNEAQAGFLAGVVAGSITKSNVIGTIGGIFTIPPVPQYMGGYENGALSVNPDIKVLSQFVSEDITKAFNDPATGRSLAKQMIALKADVILQVAGGSGQGALEAVCDANLYGIGVDVDQFLSSPSVSKCLVTSAEKKIVDAVEAAIKRVADGSAKGGTVVGDASNGGIGLAPYHDFASLITPDIQAKVDDALKKLAAGEVDPCAGPGKCFFDPDK